MAGAQAEGISRIEAGETGQSSGHPASLIWALAAQLKFASGLGRAKTARLQGASVRKLETESASGGDRTALRHEGANLVDDTGALRHQPLANPVPRLQIQWLSNTQGAHRDVDQCRKKKSAALKFKQR